MKQEDVYLMGVDPCELCGDTPEVDINDSDHYGMSMACINCPNCGLSILSTAKDCRKEWNELHNLIKLGQKYKKKKERQAELAGKLERWLDEQS